MLSCILPHRHDNTSVPYDYGLEFDYFSENCSENRALHFNLQDYKVAWWQRSRKNDRDEIKESGN